MSGPQHHQHPFRCAGAGDVPIWLDDNSAVCNTCGRHFPYHYAGPVPAHYEAGGHNHGDYKRATIEHDQHHDQ